MSHHPPYTYEPEGPEVNWEEFAPVAHTNGFPIQYDENDMQLPWYMHCDMSTPWIPYTAIHDHHHHHHHNSINNSHALQPPLFPAQAFEPAAYNTNTIIEEETALDNEPALIHSGSSSSLSSSAGSRHSSFSTDNQSQAAQPSLSALPTPADSGPSSTASPDTTQPLTQKNRKKRTRTLSPTAREETKVTRAMGACNTCRLKKKRCIRVPGSCCTRCVSEEIVESPHARSSLPDSQLFRLGPTEEFLWTKRRWLDITFDNPEVWIPNQPSVRVSIAQDKDLLPLELDLKMFHPVQEDKDTYTWTNALTKRPGSWKLPHYAVADVRQAQERIERYFKDNLEYFIAKKVGSHDVIAYRTFQLALKMSREERSDLLTNTLLLWSGSRVLETPFEIISGSSQLGLSPSTEPGSPYHNKVPVTPCMDWQIDNITITRLLQPLRKEILRELKAKIFAGKRKALVELEIYLTLFILLHNIELTTAHDRWFAQRWNVKTKFSNYTLINKTFEAANVMLTHFHNVNRGFLLFSQDWRSPASSATTTDLSPEKKNYLQVISKAIVSQASSLKKLKQNKMYEFPMFWCSQLFYDGWEHVVAPCA